MKKLINSIVFVAAAAMALVSCQKNEIDGVVKRDLHFYINAGVPETKTFIDDNDDHTYTPSWHKGDQIGIFFTEPTEKVDKVDATFSNIKESGEVATFEGSATVTEYGIFYAFYPSSAFNQHYGDGTIRLDLPAAQKPTSTSFDPSCDILVAKPCDYHADGATVVIDDLYFARIMSVLKINLLGDFAKGEIVESLTFTVQDTDITGNAKIDYKTAEIKAWNNGNVDRNVVTATYSDEEYIAVAGTNNSAYLVVAPVKVPAGKILTFEIRTSNYNITKAVTVPEDKPISFPAGNIAVINLTIEETDCEERSTETRIWVDGFDNETTNKTQTSASASGAAGTGVSNELTYSYSHSSCNIRINTNGQTANNPFLYINAANVSFTASKIKIANEENLALSALVKGNDLKLTIEYKESTSTTWSSAGTIKGTSSYTQGRVIFAVPTTATSLDIRFTGNGIMYVDDIVLESTDEEVPVVTLESIAISNQKTEYYVGDDFVKPTVIATYSDDTTADVTASATFSECDMNTTGDKTVTVTYEGKTAEYKFNVKEKGTSSETVAWVATTFTNLKEGDQVVIVSTKGTSNWAMSNDKGTGAAPTAVSGVSYSNDKLDKEPESNIIWYVGVDGENRVFYKDSSKATWLYCTATNNGIRVGTNANKTFTLDNNSGYLKHIATNRYLGVYTSTPDWRCYTNTTGNTVGQTFKFFVKSGEAGGETPEPEPDPTPDPEEPSTGVSKTAEITFGSNAVKISAASVTGTDSENNNWTITTVGTTSYTSNASYYQVGSSSKPATSITFTTTLPAGASVSNVEAKFGGFSGTAGNVTLKVGDTSVGTGKLNATSDVIVKSTSTASGNKVTVTVTDIAKGVKCYYISVNYTE